MQWRVINWRTNKSPLSVLLNKSLQYLLPTVGIILLVAEALLTEQVEGCLAHEILLVNGGTLHIETDGLVHQEVEQLGISILASLMEDVSLLIIRLGQDEDLRAFQFVERVVVL